MVVDSSSCVEEVDCEASSGGMARVVMICVTDFEKNFSSVYFMLVKPANDDEVDLPLPML